MTKLGKPFACKWAKPIPKNTKLVYKSVLGHVPLRGRTRLVYRAQISEKENEERLTYIGEGRVALPKIKTR